MTYTRDTRVQTEPLRALFQREVHWHWEEWQENALNEVKKVLTSKPVLCYYDVNKSLKLSVDASQSVELYYLEMISLQFEIFFINLSLSEVDSLNFVITFATFDN